MLSIKMLKIAVSLAAVILLCGCSASQIIESPIFNVQQLEEPIGYYSEEEMTECVKSQIEFIRQEGDLFLFYVEVESTVEDVLAIYPTEIYLEVVEDIDNKENIYTERYFAVDPEMEIAAVNRMMREEDSRHGAATVENVIIGVLNVFADLSSEREDKGVAVLTDVFGTGINQGNEEIYHSNTKDDLEASKEFWENEVLNESVLNPGDTIGGLVYLPFSKTAVLFEVIIPVCELPESHLFRQVQVNK
ncbi:hypothetical protein ACFLQ4_01850 [Bacteroidota bacterium]|jgi:hypothetical protein